MTAVWSEREQGQILQSSGGEGRDSGFILRELGLLETFEPWVFPSLAPKLQKNHFAKFHYLIASSVL